MQLEDHIVRPRYLGLRLALCHPLEVSEEGEHVAGLVEAAANDKEVAKGLNFVSGFTITTCCYNSPCTGRSCKMGSASWFVWGARGVLNEEVKKMTKLKHLLMLALHRAGKKSGAIRQRLILEGSSQAPLILFKIIVVGACIHLNRPI